MFANSTLFQKANEGTLYPSKPKIFGGINVPLVNLGDPAYPLLRWMMKPFPDCGRLTQERNFNYRLSKARVVVENAYGRLKGRRRVLTKRIDVRLEDVSDIDAACCVLHNICEAHGETFDEELLDNSFRSTCTCNSHVEVVQDRQSDAEAIRNALMVHFSEE